MALFDTIRVAAVQATPVILDAQATIDKAVALLGEAAARAPARVLPESFVSMYPSNAWAAPRRVGGWDELWERMWASVDVAGPLVARLVARVRRARRARRHRGQRARGRPGRSTTRC